MRNMKRNFAVLAATVMAVCSIALTGCQQKLEPADQVVGALDELSVKENAKKVTSSIDSQIPTLLMVSNGGGTGFSQKDWRHYATSFAKDQKNIEVTFYDAPHYLYHYHTKEVAEKIEEFIKETTE